MRNVVLGLGVVLSGVVSGYTLANPRAPLPSQEPDTMPDSSLCAGGLESDLDVDFSIASVTTKTGQERARLRLSLANRGKAETRAAYSLEFVDSRGTSIVAPSRGPNVRIAPTAHVEAALFETPEGLSDGFYMARATVVATGGGDDASELRHLYFEVRGGQLDEIEIGDYLARSDANKGIDL